MVARAGAGACPSGRRVARASSQPLASSSWSCSREYARLRAKDLGLPLIHFNHRVICVRLSDVLRTERELEKTPA
jgi:hypothetical protein